MSFAHSYLGRLRAVDAPLRANDGEATAQEFMEMGRIKTLDFTPSEWPTFGHWHQFKQTGVFQVV